MADETYQKIAILVDDKDYQRYLAEAEQHERLITGLRTVGGKAAVKALNDTERAQKQANAAAQKAHKEEQAALTALFAAQERYASELLRQQETAAGLSAEQQQLNAFIRKTEEAMKSGTITAQQYGDAQALIKQRQIAMSDSLAAGGQTAKSSAAGFQQLSFQLNDVVTQLASGAAPSQVFAQQGGQIVQAFQSAPGLFTAVASGAAGVATGFVAVAGAVAPLIDLYFDLADASKAAAAQQAILAKTQDASIPLYEKALRDVENYKMIQEGATDADKEATDIKRAYIDATEKANATSEEALRNLRAQLGYTNDLNEINAERVARGEEELDSIRKGSSEWAVLNSKIDEHISLINENNRAAVDGANAAIAVAAYTREQAEAEKALADRERDKRKATKEAVKDDKERADWIEHVNQMEQKRLSTYDDQIAALEKLQTAGEKASQSEVERVEASANAQREAAREAMVRGKTVAQTARESEQIERAYQDALRGIWAGEQAAYAELKAKEVEEAKKAADKALQEQIQRMDEGFSATADTVGATSDLFGAYYDYISADAEKMSQAQKDTALKVWKAQQALAIAEAGVNTIKGVSIALASAPPPLNLIPAGVAAAQGAAQIAAIASSPAPDFTANDTPGAVMAKTGKPVEDRANVSLHRDDIMIAGKTPGSVVGQAMALAGAGSKRSIAGEMARNPVERLLTRDVQRAARGRRR